MRRAVIFDLDGTLTQSEEGIYNCVRHAAETMGYPVPDPETLRRFIGPPLYYSFRKYMGMSDGQADEAVRIYRERYVKKGLFENSVYPGIRRLLRMLKARGDYVAVATGKPQRPSERILRYFGLSAYIDRIVGPSEDVKSADKESLIRRALPADHEEAWMVGDRKYDVEGARHAGVRSIGVGYGYGSEAELREAGCDAYAPDVESLIQMLCPGMSAPHGTFLSMEGLDGSGKSTQLRALVETLHRFGYEVVETREPGGCRISEKIRELLLSRENVGMTEDTEALLYAASRAQHVHDTILPVVESGRICLSDRFLDSSVAYQGGGRELGVQEVMDINAHAVHGLRPDITVFLELPHDVALRRRYGASEPDRMEMEGDAFHARVEQAYREMLRREPERFVVVDASESAETISQKIADRVLTRLMEREGIQWEKELS